MKVISNSSPLVDFTTLGRLDLLQKIYGTLVIPEAVYQEVRVVGQGYPGRAAIEQANWIVRETVSDRTAVAALHSLGRGEAEAIILAVENPGALLIVDDRRGRLAALNMGANIIGTLGVLLVAKRQGLLTTIKPEIESLQTRLGFRIGEDLRARVLQEAGEWGED